MGALGLRSPDLAGARDVVPSSTTARRPLRPPVVRSGTPLEVAELAWIAEGVSRETALSIPSVLACRNLLVGTIVQLELYRYRVGERLDPGYLLTRPDPSLAMPATMGGTVDDLIFRGRAYWLVLERDSTGFVTRARWTPVDDVSPQVRSSGGAYSVVTGYMVAGYRDEFPPDDVIRFDSPLPAVLDVGARTLAAALELENAARRLSSVTLPSGTLTNKGAEVSPEEGRAIVAAFEESRRLNGLAWLQSVEYSRESLSSADLQMIEARANVATDVARLFNVPVAMIGASPSGGASALLYANLTQQLALLLATGVAPYTQAIEQTLSDVIPRGQSVAFDVQTFLRSDPQAAADYAIALLNASVIDTTEARGLLGIPSSPPPAGDLTPGKV
jgi:HK97 family phage portal protein